MMGATRPPGARFAGRDICLDFPHVKRPGPHGPVSTKAETGLGRHAQSGVHLNRHLLRKAWREASGEKIE